MLVDRSLKTKKEYKNLKKQETQDIFIKKNYFKLVFNIIWVMEILKIKIEEQMLIKDLTLLKIQNMMDINVDSLQWFINFLIKKSSGNGVKNENITNK